MMAIFYGLLHGISRINSYYGKRTAPTGGASTFHKGIDIGAPEGFEFVACTDGTVSFASFLGGGGYTITLTDINTSKRRNQIFLLPLQPKFYC